MPKINIRYLATQLGLSVSTVSKALRDSHEISAETKARVQEMARQLDYRLNPYASSLRGKASNTIAVVLPEVADNFFSLAINGIHAVAEQKKYHTLIYLSHERFELEQSILDDCRSGRVDGVLISVSSETEHYSHIERLQKRNIPVVFFDRAPAEIKAPRVITNDFESSGMATQHLLQRGCRKPAFLSMSSSLSICQDRTAGYTHALPAGIKSNIILCCGNEEANFQTILNLLRSADRPDGIVAAAEKIVIQVYLACQQLKLRIPEDVQVIAFSTLETAPILNPPLSTIVQPAFQIGYEAASLLFRCIEKGTDKWQNEKVLLPSAFCERSSTLPLPDKESVPAG